MATHIMVDIPQLPLGKADLVFSVSDENSKLGALHLSKGSAVWFPNNAKHGFEISWKKLGELIEANGHKGQKR